MIIETEEDSKQTSPEAPRISTDTDAPSTSVVVQPEIPPPYSPRETDPLLRHAALRKKATLGGRCRHAVLKCLPLLLVGVTTAALTYWTMNTARSHRYPPSRPVQVECDNSSSWAWGGRTGDAGLHVANTTVIVPQQATEMLVETYTDHFFKGTMELFADPSYTGEEIMVHIHAAHSDADVLRRLSVCRPPTNATPGEAGLLFRFNSLGPKPDEMIELTIAVQFPAKARRSYTKVMHDFTAKLDYLSFHVRDLSKSVHFGDMSLSSRFGNVIVENVHARNISVFTGRGTVQGSIYGSSIRVKNEDGATYLDLNLERSVSAHTVAGSSSVELSGDGPINASLAFGSRVKPASALKVIARTSTHPIDIAVASAPLDPTLRVDAVSETGDVSVVMPLEFEGDFSVAGRRDVQVHAASGPDPSGRNRQRMEWHYSPTPDSVEGSMFWADHSPHEMGYVHIHTKGRARLAL